MMTPSRLQNMVFKIVVQVAGAGPKIIDAPIRVYYLDVKLAPPSLRLNIGGQMYQRQAVCIARKEYHKRQDRLAKPAHSSDCYNSSGAIEEFIAQRPRVDVSKLLQIRQSPGLCSQWYYGIPLRTSHIAGCVG